METKININYAPIPETVAEEANFDLPQYIGVDKVRSKEIEEQLKELLNTTSGNKALLAEGCKIIAKTPIEELFIAFNIGRSEMDRPNMNSVLEKIKEVLKRGFDEFLKNHNNNDDED